MRWLVPVPLVVLLGCALAAVSPKALHARDNASECAVSPTGAKAGFRHTRSKIFASLGSARHRGIDVVAVEGDEFQTVTGKLAYTKTDKDLEDEDVEVFACVERAWRRIGTSRTDDDGRFTLVLRDAARVPSGMRDLYARVPADNSGVRFLAYVAKPGESVIVTDLDGTITSSENAVIPQMVGVDVDHQPGAPETLAQSGKVIVYISARGDQLTEMTRRWLATHGFPKGPIRLAKAMVTLPGKRTVALKTAEMASIGVPIFAGIGNRASDIKAYRNAGLGPDRIFINLPEFTDELRPQLEAGEATPFDHYEDLRKALAR
jgi:phosphatidate phosphatase PAH1